MSEQEKILSEISQILKQLLEVQRQRASHELGRPLTLNNKEANNGKAKRTKATAQ